MLLYFDEGLFTVVGGQEFVPLHIQLLAEHVHVGGFIVNDQDGGFRTHALAPTGLTKGLTP